MRLTPKAKNDILGWTFVGAAGVLGLLGNLQGLAVLAVVATVWRWFFGRNWGN